MNRSTLATEVRGSCSDAAVSLGDGSERAREGRQNSHSQPSLLLLAIHHQPLHILLSILFQEHSFIPQQSAPLLPNPNIFVCLSTATLRLHCDVLCLAGFNTSLGTFPKHHSTSRAYTTRGNSPLLSCYSASTDPLSDCKTIGACAGGPWTNDLAEERSSFAPHCLTPLLSRDSAMASQEYAKNEPSLSTERKYQSPLMRHSSMTPPPSSQIPQLAPSAIRTPTPTHSHLSSPPPTIRRAPLRSLGDASFGMFSADHIENATEEELRLMVTEVTVAYRESRAAAAHHQLQYELFRMDRSELLIRMDVELAMAHKEVEVLQAAAQRRSPPVLQCETPILSNDNDELLNTLRNQCQHLEAENETLRNRLRQAKTLILEREYDMNEESDRLRERISENRKHMNLLRQSNGTLEGLQQSVLGTPYLGQLRHATEIHPSHIPGSKAKGDQAFAALLLADQVLNHEAGTSPVTQSKRAIRTIPPGPARRTSQTTTSVPSTPVQPRSGPSSAVVPSQHFRASRTREHPQLLIPQLPPTPSYRRRESRDSTISASDGGADDHAVHSKVERTAETYQRREGFHAPTKFVMRTPQTPKTQQSAAPQSTGLIQTKIYGRITKAGLNRSEEHGKRKLRQSDVVPGNHHNKKGRMEEGVGLGIAGLASP